MKPIYKIMMEKHFIKIYDSTAKSHPAELEVQNENNWYTVSLVSGDAKESGSGSTAFDAIAEIRHKIEPLGWRIGVNASREDAGKPFQSKGYANDLVSIFNDKKEPINVSAYQEAEFGLLSDLQYQERNHQKQMEEYLLREASMKELKNQTKAVIRRDKNRYLPAFTGLLALLSSVYPIAWAMSVPLFASYYNSVSLPFDGQIVFNTVWVLVGVFLYGIAVAASVENVVIDKKSTFTLVWAIIGPVVVTILFIAALLILGSSQSDVIFAPLDNLIP